MKKTLILSLMFIMLLGLTACGKKEEKQKIVNKSGGFEVVDNNTLMGWLKKGKAVECRIMSPEGDIIMKTKNEAVYMEGVPYMSMDSSGAMPEANNGVMLTVGDWMYTWDKVTKKGTKMNSKEMEALSSGEDEADEKDWENMAEGWEDSGFEYSCKEIKVDDSLFEEPKDVEFTDMNEMMKGLSDIGKNLEEQMNGGGMDLGDLEAQKQGL
jgi:uncharacterized lipoprotein YehR (DUF1307 family)